MVAALLCHDDIRICRICAGWLIRRTGGVDVTPTLPVANIDRAIRYYSNAGFDVDKYDDGFAFVRLDDQSVFDLDRIDGLDPPSNHAGCYIITDAAETWHERFSAAGMTVTPVVDQPWGMREFSLTDLDGNNIRIGRPTSQDG